MAKIKNKRIWPTNEEPEFNKRFIILGIQIVDIDGNYSDMFEFGLRDNNDPDKPKKFEVGSNFRQWMMNKRKISDELVRSMNAGFQRSRDREKKLPFFLQRPVAENWKEVVAFKIKYVDDLTTECIV